ncbi:amidohydrolase family protein [Acuticoccus sp. MNP-M23]|uniref:amidohydrolase family protein n=1 Tax=Acuticoccus sp. MNP-M23 TaxID=3072793 RepID=UPI002815E9FE|nr:amidohydrolase family protein [Acuticoccus sp. MNP-M23]WMS44576.1 amidohydrolase family protein [Acuticoccus sp. MNP-M23]
MCKICDLKNGSGLSRRGFMQASAAVGAGAALLGAGVQPAAAQAAAPPPATGAPGTRYVIRGGAVLTMDDAVGDFESADVLVEGGRIAEIAPSIDAGDAEVIDAAGRIVMPGFIDTHHHQFETALRSFLANGLLYNDGKPHGEVNYFEYILGKFAPVYRPEDVYIAELFAGLSQMDAGVTTVLDVSQIHHSPEHSDAAIAGLKDAGRRAAFGYFEGQGERAQYPEDAFRIVSEHFSSSDQLLTFVMGGEIYFPAADRRWQIGRELGVPIAAHLFGSFGIPDAYQKLIDADLLGPDVIAIHMTEMSDAHWLAARDAGLKVSIAAPIEMAMRHGMPPVLKSLEMGMAPSLSTDVECTMTADFFTQMRSVFTLQRALVNDMAIRGAENTPDLLTCRDVIRFATINGAKALGLDSVTGSLTPGKAADIVILDAASWNVAPLNDVPGAVVTLMDRSNVETVIVGGKVRKWKGTVQDADLPALRTRLETSRDDLFRMAGVERNLFSD